MFPWSETSQSQRMRRRRRLSDEERLLDAWHKDLCGGGELPEVEIISLLEEQIPQYKLRADTLTQFIGYENQDWFIPSPALKPEDSNTAALTTDQIRETLNYFLLCSNRVSQMTKTYNDIEAVTRLLEEKEKDIELTARIGKELLAHNQKLESNVASLETELRTANEKITQLAHELTKKTELIQILTNDVEEFGSEASTPVGSGQINFEMLQHRISRLEEENVSLRKEACQLAAATDECEEQEKRLMSDLSAQLSLVRGDLSSVASDADKWRDQSLQYKTLADSLQERLTVAEQKLTGVTKENEELSCMVTISRETQSELASELADVKDRYQEVLSLLQEAQEGLKRQRKRGTPQARGGPLFPSLHSHVAAPITCQASTMLQHDSLASELECSLFSELSLDSGIGASGSVPSYRKVFETVRCASGGSSLGGSTAGSSPIPPLARIGGGASTMMTSSQQARMSSGVMMTSSNQQLPAHLVRTRRLDSVGGSDSEGSEDFTYMTGSRATRGGTPACTDLEAALRRLTPSAIQARRAALGSDLVAGDSGDIRTPDSIMSTGSISQMSWKMPDKLKIVKPLEGSLTLHHWSQLATPSLGGLLDDNPGVRVQGGTGLEALGLQTYSLDDVEEDEEVVHPGKSFQGSHHITTWTNSTVMHPDDCTSVTPSIVGSQMCSAMSSRVSSRVSSAVATPISSRSRRNSTSTFSTALGLAKMLNERGIKAATPSTLGSPVYSPTATPANSPDHSPPSSPDRSRSPSPGGGVTAPGGGYSSPLGLPGFLMSSGAELLRRTLVGTHNSRQQERHHQRRSRERTRALVCQNKKTNIGLVETLERIGLETIMSPASSASSSTSSTPAQLQGVLTERSQPSRVPPLVDDVITTGMGVPGRPGTSVLQARLRGASPLNSGGQTPLNGRKLRTRPDLGTVRGGPTRPDLGKVRGAPGPSQQQDRQPQQTSLGTLSSMLFGRKGGLL
ncbi:trafficking kinesin-binding protein milt isoform X2 [Nilaparvata lugens]|uniref:trafficking kinesin-binding protein milt isoform X2 n=1 Tax=Nilaparvata lugens TaxID=108931 RepID=UPI00193C885D|nr:trafficking kinesin-binding protein milt isoform X2 [Nilaparvata lugens]